MNIDLIENILFGTKWQMNIEKKFEFLVKDFGLKYSYQEFNNCYGGYWCVNTYSYYNESGCFTIHVIPQKGEFDFFFAEKFSMVREELCKYPINEQSIEQGIWNNAKKKFLFEYRKNLYLDTLAKVIRSQIKKYGSFFGIKVL